MGLIYESKPSVWGLVGDPRSVGSRPSGTAKAYNCNSMDTIREQWVTEAAAGKSFAEVGGLWGTTNEQVTVAARAGATATTMIDLSVSDGSAKDLWKLFHERAADLGVTDTVCVQGSIDDPDTVERVGEFDVVCCSGVLYHCPEPLRTLLHLRAITRETLILGTATIPEIVSGKAGTVSVKAGAALLVPGLTDTQRAIIGEWLQGVGALASGINDPIAPDWDLENYSPWWWLFTRDYVTTLLNLAGFSVEKSASVWEGRATVYLARRSGSLTADLSFPDRVEESGKSRAGRFLPRIKRSPFKSNPRKLEPKKLEATQLGELAWPAGHYYSPIPSLEEIRSRHSQIFNRADQLLEIDLQTDNQLDLVQALSQFAKEANLPDHATKEYRYYSENNFFEQADGVVLYSLLRFLQPSRIVEIGSGFSSALILDTNERDLGGRMKCTFVEPYPDRLMGLLRGTDSDEVEIIASPLQDINLDMILELRENDVLFIDSSHVSKVGSDVNLLIFDVLPRLAKGVYVHIHDVFYPFEYPEQWVYQGWAWNEAYILRAYLQANAGYRIRLWNSYLAHFHRDEVARQLPRWDCKHGASIWLQRV
jgi:predicted O-methyltransferase YrrM